LGSLHKIALKNSSKDHKGIRSPSSNTPSSKKNDQSPKIAQKTSINGIAKSSFLDERKKKLHEIALKDSKAKKEALKNQPR